MLRWRFSTFILRGPQTRSCGRLRICRVRAMWGGGIPHVFSDLRYGGISVNKVVYELLGLKCCIEITSGENQVSCAPEEVSDRSIIRFFDRLWRYNINNMMFSLLKLPLTNKNSPPFYFFLLSLGFYQEGFHPELWPVLEFSLGPLLSYSNFYLVFRNHGEIKIYCTFCFFAVGAEIDKTW